MACNRAHPQKLSQRARIVWVVAASSLLAACQFQASGLPADDELPGEDGAFGQDGGSTTDSRPDWAQILPPDKGAQTTTLPFDGSNGSSALPLSSGRWTITGQERLDTDSCQLSDGILPTGVEVAAPGELCFLLLASFSLQGGRLEVSGSRPLVIVAAETIEISGLLDVSASGALPGPGGRVGGNEDHAGQGCGGGNNGHLDLSVAVLGGAGGSFGGQGGSGAGGPAAPAPLTCVAHACLDPLVGGSGGGRGGNLLFYGAGGGGGGAVQLSAGSWITVSAGGVISAGGGGGEGASEGGGGGGGGGGSGGGILLESPRVTVQGILAANGGGGGGGSMVASAGQDGEDGAPSLSQARGGAGSDVFLATGGKGGEGSAGAETSGGAGQFGQSPIDTGGGGGGGAGRICIRSDSGQYIGPAQLLSPSTEGLLLQQLSGP